MLETIENRVTRAAKEIKSNYAEAINIENLAKKLGISASSLYHNFKRITALSPLQFQKKIRLEEAKNLLINQNLDAAEAAFARALRSLIGNTPGCLDYRPKRTF